MDGFQQWPMDWGSDEADDTAIAAWLASVFGNDPAALHPFATNEDNVHSGSTSSNSQKAQSAHLVDDLTTSNAQSGSERPDALAMQSFNLPRPDNNLEEPLVEATLLQLPLPELAPSREVEELLQPLPQTLPPSATRPVKRRRESGKAAGKNAKVARTSQACTECRAAKTRCMGESLHPCARCVALRRTCIYSRGSAGGVQTRNESMGEASMPQSKPVLSNTPPIAVQQTSFATMYCLDELDQFASPPNVLAIPSSGCISQDDNNTNWTSPGSGIPLSGDKLTSLLPALSTTLASHMDELFRHFFTSMNPRWALLQPHLHTPAYCAGKSDILVYAILFVAARHSEKHAFLRADLGEVVRGMVFRPQLLSIHALETVQALLILSLWGTDYIKRGIVDYPWLMICFAARMALDMDLGNPLADTANGYNIQRTWLLTFIVDHTKSMQRNRHPTIAEFPSALVRQAKAWAKEEPECVMLIMYAELLLVVRGTLQNLRSNSENAKLVTDPFADWTSVWRRGFHAGLRATTVLPPLQRALFAALIDFYTSYWSLLVTSIALQNALDAGSPDSLSYCTRCIQLARAVIEVTENELVRQAPISDQPDGHLEFVLHACVFLLKLASPRYRELTNHLEDHSFNLVPKFAKILLLSSKGPLDSTHRYSQLISAIVRNAPGCADLANCVIEQAYGPRYEDMDDNSAERVNPDAVHTQRVAQTFVQSQAWNRLALPGLGSVSCPDPSDTLNT